MRERVVENWLRRSVRGRGGLAVKLVPSVAGLPDRLVLLPGGRVVFVETKAPDGKVKFHQLNIHEFLRSLGFRVDVLSTLDEVNEWVAEVLPK